MFYSNVFASKGILSVLAPCCVGVSIQYQPKRHPTDFHQPYKSFKNQNKTKCKFKYLFIEEHESPFM